MKIIAASPSPPSAVVSVGREFLATLAKLKKKLITKDDVVHIHALSSALSVLMLLACEACLLTTIVTTGKMWVPASWPAVLLPLISSTFLSQLSGIFLALRFRRGTSRRAFVLQTLVNLSLMPNLLILTECWPRALTSAHTPLPAILMVFLNLVSFLQGFAENDELLHSAKYSPGSPPSKAGAFQIYLAYMGPFLGGPLVNMVALKGYLMATPKWAAAFQLNHPEYYPYIFSFAIQLELAIQCMIFALTLRRRRVVSANVEMALASLPAFLPLSFFVWAWYNLSWLPDFTRNIINFTIPMPL